MPDVIVPGWLVIVLVAIVIGLSFLQAGYPVDVAFDVASTLVMALMAVVHCDGRR